MLKRVLIAAAASIAVLFVINWVSLFAIPYVHPVAECGHQHDDENHPAHNDCTLTDGIISEGFAWLSERHSEFWTALGTIVIGFFTATLWRSTDQIRRAGDKQLKVSRQIRKAAHAANEKVKEVERAYLTGGGGQKGGVTFHVEVGNYGKTPAFLDQYAVESCELEYLPAEPIYHRRTFVDRIPPGSTKRLTEFAPSMGANPIVYGRFWYRDIWNEHHSFGFILALRNKRSHPDVQGVSDSYTNWT